MRISDHVMALILAAPSARKKTTQNASSAYGSDHCGELETLRTAATFRRLYGWLSLPQTDPMDEIEELRRALGPVAKDYNDIQLRQLSRDLDLMGEFLLDLYALRRSGQPKVEIAGFDTPGSEPVA